VTAPWFLVAQRLERTREELGLVAPVRIDVVAYRRQGDAPGFLACAAKRVLGQLMHADRHSAVL
jgi:hypothetical protein